MLLIDGELRPHLPFRKQVVDRKVFDPAGEAFIEPEIGPPAHSDEIAEPLMGELVGYYHGNVLFV